MNRLLGIASVTIASVVLSCARPPGAPNLLLVTIDTVRADRLGCYGYAAATTATLDSLAADGVVFERAYSPYPLTLPSHTSMLSGRLPFEHGVRNNDQIAGEGAPLVAQTLHAQGIATAAVVSAFVLDHQFGLSRGFDRYEDRMPRTASGEAANERPAKATTDLALSVLDDLAGDQFFLWVHYFDPHYPYSPPASWSGDPYDGEIATVDRELGRLLRALRAKGLSDRTAIIVAGDHGEAFGEHGEVEHGLFVYDTTLHVPLLLRLPGAQLAGRRISAPVGLADVGPTLLSLARAGDGRTFPFAQNLIPVARDSSDRSDLRPLYAETLSPCLNYGASPLASVRLGDWKYIEAPTPELYDLRTDPGEEHNLAPERPELASRYRDQLASMHSLDWMTAVDPLADVTTDASARERLASLGYVSAHDGQGTTTRPDPKIIVDVGAKIRDGNLALARGDTSAAETAFLRAMEIDPGNWKASWKLARLYEQQQRLDDAVEIYHDAIEASPTNVSARLNLGSLLLRMGESARALPTLDAVVRAKPDLASAHALRGLALGRLGRIDEARAECRTALRLDPEEQLAAEILRSLGAGSTEAGSD
jgi:choline-sulfatase